MLPASLMYMYIYMILGSELARTIAVSDDVYELLKRSKLPNESFSAVIRRSIKKGKLSEIAGSGTLSRADWETAKKQLLKSEKQTLKKLTESR